MKLHDYDIRVMNIAFGYHCSSQLEVHIEDLEDKLKRLEKDLKERNERHRVEVSGLRETVRVKEEEKDCMLRDKDTLLDEVSLTN